MSLSQKKTLRELQLILIMSCMKNKRFVGHVITSITKKKNLKILVIVKHIVFGGRFFRNRK